MSSLVDLFHRETGLSLDDLYRIISTAPRRYKTFTIPKRSGGVREIAHPARELKVLQRIMLHTLMKDLPVHPSAKAYVSGQSIAANARAHAGSSPILKMDFQNFFPSIRSDDWAKYCRRTILFQSEEDIRISSQLLFRRIPKERLLKLSIGAPTSPLLSNILMYSFDEFVTKEAEARGVVYTRYADDLTFSGQRIGMLKDMRQVVAAASRASETPRLILNPTKTAFVTTKHRRSVTGVILTNDGNISLGRKRQRNISAMVHRFTLDRLDEREVRELAGLLAYVNVVNPQFLTFLVGKYGVDAINRIKRGLQEI